MLPANNSLSQFYRRVWLTFGMWVIHTVVFVIYVQAEKQIDHANELRFQSYVLASQLRQSSDDLTQMARSYVITGNPIYKQHYQEIAAIRDGKKPRPVAYQNIYWDLVQLDDKRPRPNSKQTIALLELMRQAHFTDMELAKLAQAKANSDALINTELAAMKLVDSTAKVTDKNRLIASDILYDAAYHQAKANIMRPINEFQQLMNQRTLNTVRAAKTTARLMLLSLILIGLVLLYLLCQIYRALHAILGCSVNELHAYITQFDAGGFSASTTIAKGMENSVLGWLSTTQEKLAHTDTERKSIEAQNQRLTQLYAVLNQCNQAIVRCSDEAELFPQICHDAVTFGSMKMAWIGLLEAPSKYIKPVASYGYGIEYLEKIDISLDADHPSSHGPTGTAIRENRPVWCQDFQHDPTSVPWHERSIKFGWGAVAALPLHRNDAVIGALVLYSAEPNTFDEAIRNLLVEMAMDIDYALNSYALEKQRQQAEYEWRKLSQVVEQSRDAIIITDLNANIEYANLAYTQLTGYSQAELIGARASLLKSGKTSQATYQSMWARITSGGIWQGEAINKRKDGTEYTALLIISPIYQADGRATHYVEIQEDITERKKSEQHLQYLANFDVLTGLPNRAQLTDHAKHAISLAKRDQRTLALMFLDLDHFKDINDTLGHTLGDVLLVELAKRLQLILREEDIISRLGGDEFILLLPNIDVHGARQVAEKILVSISRPYQIDQNELNTTASIGIALYPKDGLDMETLSKRADAAMYRVKQEGRNGYHFFTEEMQARSTRNLALGNALCHALELDQLVLNYQPQLSMQDGRIVGAEALLRWQHPEFGLVPPAEFIPIAEENRLILPIGEWVIRRAVEQAKIWMRDDLNPLVVAVNLSAVQFRHPDLPSLITRILDEVGLPPEYLELELTESLAMHEPQTAINVMNNLRERGIRMSIDDFGTGYSSLSYLKKFKIAKLKIDQSFVRDIGTDHEDEAIICAIINIAKSLGLITVAEGVETKEQLTFLREQGCEEAQGYYYSKPLSAEQFMVFMKSSKLI